MGELKPNEALDNSGTRASAEKFREANGKNKI